MEAKSTKCYFNEEFQKVGLIGSGRFYTEFRQEEGQGLVIFVFGRLYYLPVFFFVITIDKGIGLNVRYVGRKTIQKVIVSVKIKLTAYKKKRDVCLTASSSLVLPHDPRQLLELGPFCQHYSQ